MPASHFLPTLAFSLAVAAQNLVPNGEFHDGSTGWTRTAFNDPLGSTGFAPARTAGEGPSMAVYADFRTLTSVMSATFRGPAVLLPGVPLPVGFRVMWEKPTTTAPIPSPSVNRVELRIVDTTTNAVVYTGTRAAPNQTGTFERATFSAVATIPATGTYQFELFLRHSNLAGIPFVCWVDDVHCGGLAIDFYGQGCAGSGGFVPAISSSNSPAVNTNNFSLDVTDVAGPGFAVYLLDLSNTTWAGGALPYPLGGGCNLLNGAAVALYHPIATQGPGTGSASQILPIPNFPGLAGVRMFGQWAGYDLAAPNPYGFTMSAGLSLTIQ